MRHHLPPHTRKTDHLRDLEILSRWTSPPPFPSPVTLRHDVGAPSNSMDHRRLTYHAPAIPSASGFEDERSHICQFCPWEGEGAFVHLLGERDPRFALAVQDHPGIRLRRICKE